MNKILLVEIDRLGLIRSNVLHEDFLHLGIIFLKSNVEFFESYYINYDNTKLIFVPNGRGNLFNSKFNIELSLRGTSFVFSEYHPYKIYHSFLVRDESIRGLFKAIDCKRIIL